MTRACSFSGCRNDVRAGFFCGTHYWQRNMGRELTPIRYKGGKRDRFWEKVNKSGPLPSHRPELGPCWVWTGAMQKGGGYGLFWTAAGLRRAHKYSYVEARGPVPTGLELDHLCRNRACVNPDHLEAVSHSVNTLRGFAARRKVPESGSKP
jgi:hypothetical protein